MFFKSRSNSPNNTATDQKAEYETRNNPMPVKQTLLPRSERPRPRSAPGDIPPSIIAEDMRIVGDVTAEGDVQIDGIIEGNLTATSTVIGKAGVVNGSLIADTLKIFGKVLGEIRAKNVSLMESAEITGNLYHSTLEMAKGACVNGTLKNMDFDATSADAIPGTAVATSQEGETAAPAQSTPAIKDRSAVAEELSPPTLSADTQAAISPDPLHAPGVVAEGSSGPGLPDYGKGPW